MIGRADIKPHRLGPVSRMTMLLQISVVFLVIGLFYLLVDISHRYSILQNGFRENAVWSIYQLDRESRKFLEALHRLAEDHDLSPASTRAAVTRYDIVYSRIKTVEQGRFDINVRADTDIAKGVMAIKALILENQPLFDQLSTGTRVPDESLARAKRNLDGLLCLTEELLTYTNNAASVYRSDTRADLSSLEMRSAVLIGLLVVCVGCLVYSLRRQLKSMQEAGTRLEAMADRLNAAYLDAEAGNRAKSQFMATMGHEVRTPLNAILGTAELLQLATLPPSIASGVGTIRRSGEALLEIINEVLDFAKIEHGNLVTETRAVDVKEVAAAAMEMIRGRAVENGNEVTLDIDPTFSGENVMTDPTRLRQVLLNLMSNAAKFTSDGVITLRLYDTKGPGGSAIRFDVRDTGIGIDPANLGRLFQPFTQGDASISRRFGGTGLGLAICKQVVERMGGRIGAESRPGEGSTFWFEIPRIACSENAGATENDLMEDGEVMSAPVPKLNVLLVEDNKINQEVATGLLRHLGQTVTIAADGLQAVSQVQAQSFDLILMDMQMPVLDGIEAAKRIRALGGRCATVPIVAMTANASDHDRQLCEDAGMDDFRSKPVSLSQLQELICSATEAQAVLPVPRIEEGDFQQRSEELVSVLGKHDFIDLLRHFFSDADGLVAELSNAIARGDFGAADRLLHSLRGAATSVCLQQLADQVQAMRERGPSDQGVSQLRDELAARRQRLAA